MVLFSVTCTTCTSRLSVRDASAIGQILECPKCGSMVEIAPPPDWRPPTPAHDVNQAKDTGRSHDTPAQSAAPAQPQAPARSSAQQSAAAKRTTSSAAKQSTTSQTETPAAAQPPARRSSAPPQSAPQPAVSNQAATGVAQQPQTQPPAPQSDDHAVDPVEDAVATAARALRRKLLLAGAPVAVLLVVMAYMAWPRQTPAVIDPESTPAEVVSNPPIPTPPEKTDDPPPLPKKEPTPPPPAAVLVDRQWLPPGTQAVVSLRLPQVVRDETLATMLERSPALWERSLRPLAAALRLGELARGPHPAPPKPDVAPHPKQSSTPRPTDLEQTAELVQRATWATQDVRQFALQSQIMSRSVLVLELNHAASDSWPMEIGAVRCAQLQLGGAVCYQLAAGAWTHPFALVNARTIVTGPLDLLKQLPVEQRRDGADEESPLNEPPLNPVIEPLLAQCDLQQSLVVLADAEALRKSPEFSADWLPADAEWAEPLRTLRTAPHGVLVGCGLASELSLELKLFCGSDEAAKNVEAALARLRQRLPELLRVPAESLLKLPEAADLESAVFTDLQGAIAAAATGQREQAAWVRLVVRRDPSQTFATCWHAWLIHDFRRRPAEPVDPRLVIDPAGLELRLREVEYRQAPLSGFVEEMSRLANVPMALDLEALGDAGIAPDTKVSVKLADATVAEALRAALEPHGLEALLGLEGLSITTANRQASQRRAAEYDVADLANDELATNRLAELCRRFLELGSTTVTPGKLRVTQSGAMHDDLALFLDKLRLARGLSPRRTGQRLETQVAPLRDRLATLVTANFAQGASLPEIARFLGQQAKVKILVDRVALLRAGVDASDGVVFAVEKEPLSEALRRLCQQVDLAWRIADEKTLQITSLAAERGTVEFYPLADLLRADRTAETLVAQLREQVAPESWSADMPEKTPATKSPPAKSPPVKASTPRTAAKSGVVQFDAASRHLIVRQTQAVHLQIERWLDAQRVQPAPPPEVGKKQ